MPTTDCAAAMPVADSQIDSAQTAAAPLASGGASKLLKGMLFGFAASVTIGLALASWYVGVRIVAAGEAARSAPTPPHQSATPAAGPASAEDSMAEAYWYTVPPAEFYLEVGGLGPKRDAAFAAQLQAQGFHAQIQASDDSQARIRIGPFSNRAGMEEARQKLQSEGVLAAETTH